MVICWKSKFNFKGQPTKKHCPDSDTYNHSAGMAARFGRPGLCFSIVTDQPDEYALKDFCKVKELNIPLKFIEYISFSA